MYMEYTLNQARTILDVSVEWLAHEANINPNTIYRIETGASMYATHVTTASAIADALYMSVDELKWPNGLSEYGRPAMTGTPLTLRSHVTQDKFCPEHHLMLSVTNECISCLL